MPAKGLKPLKQLLLTATFSSVFVLACHAQDPPTRVADLNYIEGNISMQPAGAAADDWSPAVVNRPLTTGDNLWADADSRAELHLNNAVLRLGPQTSLGFLNLDDHFAQLRLSQGEFFLRVRHLDGDDSFEVDTPNAALTILREGEYRFSVDPNAGTSWAVVRHGEAEVTGGGQAFTLRAGQSAQLSGTDQLAYDVGTLPQPDGFEGWAEDRDNREAHSQTARYLPPDVIGSEQLDAYGTWRDTPGYGAVWYPRVDAGWAPYHDGHWAWVEPWGWTWVDDAPWGFAPCHYGRWAYANGGWGWIPGPLAIVGGRAAVAVVYAPALVAFIGGGGWGASLSIGGPAVGWVPLGPGEVYAPSYQMSQNYFRTVNVSNTTVVNTVNITNVYNNVYVNKNVTNVTVNQHFANMAAPNAVVAMPQNAFASGRPVKQGGISVPQAQVAQVTAHMAVAPSVAPARQALAPTAGGRPAPQPPARAVSVQVVAKKAPPPPPVPFAAKQAALQQNLGRPVNIPAIRQSMPPARAAVAAPAVRVAPPSRPVTPQVKTAPPSPPARAAAPPTAPANRPPAQPAPQANPRPAQPAPVPRPPQAAPEQRPPAQPAPQANPRPAQPAPVPRPPQAAPEQRPPAPAPRPPQPAPEQRPPAPAPRPPQPAPEQRTPAPAPRPAQPAPEQRPPAPAPRPPQAAPEQRPPAPAPRPPQPAPAEQRPPAPQANPRPAPPSPQQKPPAKPPEKPKKETEKEKTQ